MSKQLVIGCDVDGVLADFNTAYRQRLIDVTGRELIPPFVDGYEPGVWNYATDEYGYTKEEDNRVWESIIADPFFWENLHAYYEASTFLWGLHPRGDIYYITTRPGYRVKRQTEKWLAWEGPTENPTVLIAKDARAKGQIAAGLGLTHFIDDRPENCFAVAMNSPDTKTYLLAHKYNLWARKDVTTAYFNWVEKADSSLDNLHPTPRITVIHSLDEFLTTLRRPAGFHPAGKAA